MFTFEDCSIDCDQRELRRGGDFIGVEPQVFDVLVYLIRNRHRVVSRDDLLASVWGGRMIRVDPGQSYQCRPHSDRR